MYAVLSATNNSAAQASNVAINWPVPSTTYPQSGYSRVQRSALREPITKGTNGNDNFSLNSKTKGLYWGSAGDDIFDYGNDPGTLNTRIAGGLGSDTFALSKLTAAQVLDALKTNNYTFIMRSNGFVLRTADGQDIQVANVEKIAFSDKTFDLTNSADMKALVDALKSKNITILDERNKPALTRYNSEVAAHNCNPGQQSIQPNPANLIPLNSSNYPQSPNGWGNSQATNITPEQAYFMGLGYAMYQNMMKQGNGLSSAYNPHSYSNTYGASQAASVAYTPANYYNDDWGAYGGGSSAAGSNYYNNDWDSYDYSVPAGGFTGQNGIPVYGLGMASLSFSNTNNIDSSSNISISSVINN